MSAKFEYGPLDTYEVIWNSGHVEQVRAHQVLAPRPAVFGDHGTSVWMFHGEIDGKWRLLLVARDEDIKSVRNLTHTRDAAESEEKA